ncbi:conserved hypothetical protein [Theileria orientalis strain Shintoku]|uniref:Major facilitator superfamily MFS-1 protein n=1 Tax=Theileria orientalis strain Shintoku TaxID=869250 RepID=J4D7Y9_THEOR|nr:conserved hypothetical protein [Theileria orientalis strain Shintoku]PVC52155.1 hypothetical protein MACL_00001006 [Theileria orientalis]BAM40455.1 conserved hypothetical protein [Theileria orientalis strain Shintoku]|eukprot:XP_009690756.1 conserved hypothetical protein [Theileria orientalis strain Shintoku]
MGVVKKYKGIIVMMCDHESVNGALEKVNRFGSMIIKTTKVPIRIGYKTYKVHDIKIGCRFGIRLLVYFMLLIFIGPYFGNWNTTEKFLCRLDVYAGECGLSERLAPATDSFRCAAQRFRIAKLGSVVRVSVLTIGFVLGLLLDILGPKLTFLIGIVMRMGSWFIFSIKGARSSMIIFSGVMLGLSRNAIAYPTLTIYMYTTSFKEYATTIMGIGITLAGLYIIVIERLMGFTKCDPYKFTRYSMLVTHIPCLLVGLVIFPWNSPTPKLKQKMKAVDSQGLEYQSSTDDYTYNSASYEVNSSYSNSSYSLEQSPSYALNQNKIKSHHSDDSRDTSPDSPLDLVLGTPINGLTDNSDVDSMITPSVLGNKEADRNPDLKLEVIDDAHISRLHTKNTTVLDRSVAERTSTEESDVEVDGDVQIPIDHSQWNLKKFLRYLTGMEYAITCPYFVLNFLDFFFMQMMFSTMYGRYKDVIVLNEYLVSFSFILTFLIGFLYKVFNPVTILVFSNMFGILTHFVAFSSSRVAGYLAAFTLIAYASILFTQTYIYIQSTFDAKYFGSLVGTINTLSGLVMFFNILLISLVEKYGCTNKIHIAMIVARSICGAGLVFLSLRRRKRTKSI